MFINSNESVNERTGKMVVVEKSVNIEREVDQYIKNIRSLINKLSPTERQKYYNGMLSFIVNEQIELTSDAQADAIDSRDLSKLTTKELTLLEEMSTKMQQLYQVIGHDTE